MFPSHALGAARDPTFPSVADFIYKKTAVRIAIFVVAAAGLFSLTACQKKPASPPPPPPPEVGVVTIISQPIPVSADLPGRLDPVRVAEVRARATGILLKRLFEEGTEVKEGDVLFEIDPAPLQAALESAKAALARAEANQKQAQATADRYKALVQSNAISRQQYDVAAAASTQGDADVNAAKAALQTSSLNLGYTKVTAPISGRIGKALVTEGALVSQSDATRLAVIQQLDPLYFDFAQSSTEVLRLRRELDAGHLKSLGPGQARVTLVLEDGSVYPQPGKLLFTDVTVDPTTSMVSLRAEIPNPDRFLLPGMFARGRFEQAVNAQAVLVPQRGILVGATGAASALVVTADNKVESRPVQLGNAIGDNWVINQGVKPGDRVIVDGLQRVRPGAVVKPVPFAPPSNSPPPASPTPGSNGNKGT